MTEDLRYPIGRLQMEETTDEPGDSGLGSRREWIDQIERCPAQLRAAVQGLTDEQLDTPYRPGGWTVRQVVHHLPDSHMNAYVRFRLGLTEETPRIKAYLQEPWASLPDARTAPVGLSLDLLDALHRRWVALLRALGPEDFRRTIDHPESGLLTLGQLLSSYAWHGRHHVAHVTSLRGRMGW
jgi:hypothetical protein